MTLKSVKSLKNLRGKKVLLRLTLNVPIKGRVIQNDFRLQRVLPTLKWLRKQGAKTIVISHIGSDGSGSLRRIVRYLNKYIEVGFFLDNDKDRRKKLIDEMKNGSIFVLENIRRYPGEKNNSKRLAKELADLADVYVNEDFSVAHREHASVVGVPELIPSYFGPLFVEEIDELSRTFKAKKPFVVILGGAKFETKLPLVEAFLPKADKIFVTGALANSFYKELGFETGKSLVDKKNLDLKTLAKNPKIVVAPDVVVKNGKDKIVKKPEDVSKSDSIMDAGPETIKAINEAVKEAKFVLWNGPLGKFEDGFSEATEEVAKKIAKSQAYSVVGGGDSVSAINKLGILKKFDFVSTGGGAMLDFLADGSLPGIEAIHKNWKK